MVDESIYVKPSLEYLGYETREKQARLLTDTFGKDMADYLIFNGFLDAPASTKWHGNYRGGLFEHSLYVGIILQCYTKNLRLEWERPESPMIIGLLHDLCKIDCYKIKQKWEEVGEPIEISWDDTSIIKGHGEKSVIYALQHIKLTEEEIACIRYHMGAYQTDEWEFFGKAIEKYPNVLYTHMADMHASKIFRV